MSNWIKDFFSKADRFLDIFNVGRLVFYTFSGLLSIYPFAMLYWLLLEDTRPPPAMLKGFDGAAGLVFTWQGFIVSTVVGFLIAEAGFALIIRDLLSKEEAKLKRYNPPKYSINYQYPFLRNDEKDDYQGWLTSEYFRFIEIATFVPVGFIIGLWFSLGYMAVYVLYVGFEAPYDTLYPALLFMPITATLIGGLTCFVWPELWKPRVLQPIVGTYLRAKIALVDGVEYVKKESKRQKEVTGVVGTDSDDK